MTVKQLKDKLNSFPDDYEVCLWSDENSDGIAVQNPRGRITTTEEVIELP